MQPTWIPIDNEALRRWYVDEQLTIDEIASRLRCSPMTIARRLRAGGMPIRRRGPNPARIKGRHPSVRPPITWAPALAWVVGLIATDGNLSRHRHLSITSKDRDLLETVKDQLGLTNRIARVKGSNGDCWRLQWGDGLFYTWLTDIGLTPAKSLTLKPLPVPDDFFRDFLRGCIDGDGCILIYTDRYHVRKKPHYVYERLYVSVVSASRPFLEWLLTTTRRLLGGRGAIRVSVKSANPVYALRFAKADSIRLLRWIYYTQDVPCLQRKRAKATPFLSEALTAYSCWRGSGGAEYTAVSKAAARKGSGVQIPSPLPFPNLDSPAPGPVP